MCASGAGCWSLGHPRQLHSTALLPPDCPQVLAVVHEARPDNSQRWVPPTHCPSCSSPLASQKPGYSSQPGQLFCVNRACPEQSTARLRYFCSKMDIRGLGPRTLDLLLGVRPELELHHLYGLTQVSGGLRPWTGIRWL